MEIPSPKYLKNKARLRLDSGQDPGKVVLWYAGISSGAVMLSNIIGYILSEQLSHAGGLANIGTRSFLSTANVVISILTAIFLMALSLGYLAAMLRISRNQYTSPATLKAGAERFFLLLRVKIFCGLLYFIIGVAAVLLTSQIFSFTPYASRLMDSIAPYIGSETISADALLGNEAVAEAMNQASLPLMVIFLILYVPALLFVSYRYRLADYLIIDNPGIGALGALKTSRTHMNGNCIKLLTVDLSFWWYYGLQLLVQGLLYLDLILALLGIPFPAEGVIGDFLPVVAYLAANFAFTVLFRNRVEVAYALAYNSAVPREKPQDGAVLGSIFQN